MPTTHITITNLDYLIRNSNYRQYEVAGICGIHPTEFSKLVRGLKGFKTVELVKLAKVFGVAPDEIVGWRRVEVDG